MYRGGKLVYSGWKESEYPPEKTQALLNELFIYLQSGKPILKPDKNDD